MVARILLVTFLAFARSTLQAWQMAPIDYSAANEYVKVHYPHLHTGDYFRPSTGPSTGADEPIFNGRLGVHDDRRGRLVPASLAECGFALLKPPRAAQVDDWRDGDAVRATYLPKLRQLITDAVEQSPAHGKVSELIFWHMLVREQGAPYVGPSDAASSAVSRGPIAPMAHVDTDVNAYAGHADRLAQLVLANQVIETGRAPFAGDLVEQLSGRRFCILNAWRNADNDHPILRAPLALLATRHSEVDGPWGRFPEHLPDHTRSRWYAFPRMESEVLCFTQYDRKLGSPSELWHCALSALEEAPGSPPRRSFEVRALVLLEETLPLQLDRWLPLPHNRPVLSHYESGQFCDEQACKRKAAPPL